MAKFGLLRVPRSFEDMAQLIKELRVHTHPELEGGVGPQGPQGEPGPAVDTSTFVRYTGATSDVELGEHQVVSTVSTVINRTGDEITSVDFSNGRTITFTRAGGEVTSWTDGTNTWTVDRVGGRITGITVS